MTKLRVLTLPLHKVYFEQIKSGEKVEEYRLRTDYWAKRLEGREYDKMRHASAIITNPPYGKGNRDAVRWAELSLKRCHGIVALLLTAKFDFGSTRRHLFRDNPRFCAKIALVDRLSWTLDGETGTEDHAWYVWHSEDRVQSQYGKPIMLWEGKTERKSASQTPPLLSQEEAFQRAVKAGLFAGLVSKPEDV